MVGLRHNLRDNRSGHSNADPGTRIAVLPANAGDCAVPAAARGHATRGYAAAPKGLQVALAPTRRPLPLKMLELQQDDPVVPRHDMGTTQGRLRRLPEEESGGSSKARGVVRSLSEVQTSNGSVHLRLTGPAHAAGTAATHAAAGKTAKEETCKASRTTRSGHSSSGAVPRTSEVAAARAAVKGEHNPETAKRAVLAAVHGSDYHSFRSCHHCLGTGRQDDRARRSEPQRDEASNPSGTTPGGTNGLDVPRGAPDLCHDDPSSSAHPGSSQQCAGWTKGR